MEYEESVAVQQPQQYDVNYHPGILCMHSAVVALMLWCLRTGSYGWSSSGTPLHLSTALVNKYEYCESRALVLQPYKLDEAEATALHDL